MEFERAGEPNIATALARMGRGFSEGTMLIGDTPERFRALFGF
jgi:hypothetical protein